MTDDRICACGCAEPMRYRRSDAQYFSNACRTRAHRAKVLRDAQIAREASQSRYTAAADAFWAGYRDIRRSGLRGRWARETAP